MHEAFHFFGLLFLLTPALIQVFLHCFYGAKITAMSEIITAIFFHSDWCRESKAYQMNAKIFMEVSRKPLRMKAGRLYVINLETFAIICKGAYSLYAVFKKVN